MTFAQVREHSPAQLEALIDAHEMESAAQNLTSSQVTAAAMAAVMTKDGATVLRNMQDTLIKRINGERKATRGRQRYSAPPKPRTLPKPNAKP